MAALAYAQDDEAKCCCTTYDTSVCLTAVRKAVDHELNTTYLQAMEKMKKHYTAQDVQNLRTAERLWIAYRDATCNAEYGLWGKGSGGPNAFGFCIVRMTKQRIVDIKNAYLPEH